MNSKLVSIDNLDLFFTKLKTWLKSKYTQTSSESTITQPKIAVVNSMPASPDANTLYFVKSS